MRFNPKPKPPMPGGEYTHVSDTGPQPVPPGIPRVNLIPVGDGGPGPLLPRVTRRPRPKTLLPRPEEIAKLPRLARVAFATCCVRRALPAQPGTAEPPAAVSDDPRAVAEIAARAAEAILRVATDPTDLRFLRRDFERFRWLAKHHGWTDDTPVSPDAIGPRWPRNRTPQWARETKKPRE